MQVGRGMATVDLRQADTPDELTRALNGQIPSQTVALTRTGLMQETTHRQRRHGIVRPKHRLRYVSVNCEAGHTRRVVNREWPQTGYSILSKLQGRAPRTGQAERQGRHRPRVHCGAGASGEPYHNLFQRSARQLRNNLWVAEPDQPDDRLDGSINPDEIVKLVSPRNWTGRPFDAESVPPHGK